MSTLSTIAWTSTLSTIDWTSTLSTIELVDTLDVDASTTASTSTLSTIAWTSTRWTTSSTSMAPTTPGATSLATDWTISVAPSSSESNSPGRRRRPRRAWRAGHDVQPGRRRVRRRPREVAAKASRQALDQQVGLGKRRRVEGDADVEAIVVAEGGDVHRAAEPRPERVAAPRSSDPQMWRSPRRPGTAVAAKSTESAWACSAGSKQLGRQPAERCGHASRPPATPARGAPAPAARRRRRTAVPAGRPTVGTSSRAGANQLPPASSAWCWLVGVARRSSGVGSPSSLVVARRARRPRRRRAGRCGCRRGRALRPGAVDREHLEVAAAASASRARRQRPAGDHQLAGHRVGDVEGPLDAAHGSLDRRRSRGPRADAVDEPADRPREVDRDRERAGGRSPSRRRFAPCGEWSAPGDRARGDATRGHVGSSRSSPSRRRPPTPSVSTWWART